MALPPIYDPVAVEPMWRELQAVGVDPLTTPEDVDAAISADSGTVLMIVNSICGCAAGNARPGAMLGLQHSVIPDRSVTVFAGVDRDAVERARALMSDYAPSSPSMGLFKDGKQVFMLERSQIERMDRDQVASALRAAFDEHCTKAGPSIDPEEFAKVTNHEGCGSQVPMYVGRG
jgi:putative YphP/YqiW family bacilliredoxin